MKPSNGNSHITGKNARWRTEMGKTVCQCLLNLNIYLPYDLAILCLGTYPKQIKNNVHAKTYTPVFMAVPFIISQTENKMTFNRWMDKKTVSHQYGEILLHNEREPTIDARNILSIESICWVEEARLATLQAVCFYYWCAWKGCRNRRKTLPRFGAARRCDEKKAARGHRNEYWGSWNHSVTWLCGGSMPVLKIHRTVHLNFFFFTVN